MLTQLGQRQGRIPQLHRGDITVNGHVFLQCWAILDNKKQFFKNQQDYKNTQQIVSLFWGNRINPYIGGEIVELSFTSGKKDYSIVDLIGVARDDTKLRWVQDYLTPRNKNKMIRIGNREFFSEEPNHIQYTDLMPQQRFFLTPKRRRLFSQTSLLIDIALVSEQVLDYQLRAAFCGARSPMLAEYHFTEAFPNYEQEQVESYQTHFQE